MVEHCFIDLNWCVCIREGREAVGLARGDEFLGCPDVVGGGASQKSGSVVVLSFLYCLEVAEPGLPCKGQGFLLTVLFCDSGHFGVLFP